MNKQLFYFGCMNGPGHYWHSITNCVDDRHVARVLGINYQIVKFFDATFAPPKMLENQYTANLLGPISIVAWWDNSVDPRPNSNSGFIGKGYNGPNELLADAADLFQVVIKRQRAALIPYQWL